MSVTRREKEWVGPGHAAVVVGDDDADVLDAGQPGDGGAGKQVAIDLPLDGLSVGGRQAAGVVRGLETTGVEPRP